MIDLRIVNIICSGRLPIKKKLDFKKIIQKSKFIWQVCNEEISPILSTRFYRTDEERLNVQKKKKSIYVSVWYSGAINIVGVLSLEEAEKYYNKVVSELKRILGENL